MLVRSAEGAYAEKHLPLPEAKAYTSHGPRRSTRRRRRWRRSRRSGLAGSAGAAAQRSAGRSWQAAFFADNVQKPTAEELHDAQHHAEHELHELEAQIAAGPNRHGPTEGH